jgi:hypothetical protein
MRHSWRHVRTVLLLAAAVAPACGDGDDDAGPMVPGPPSEASILALVERWTDGLEKRCSVDGILDSGSSSELDRPGLDAAMVLTALGGRLQIESGGEAVVLDTPGPLQLIGTSERRVTVSGTGGPREMLITAARASDGACVVSIDGSETYRGQLWERLPVLAQVKSPAALAAIRVDGGTRAYVGTVQSYLEIDGLGAVLEALAADVPSASALVGPALGLSAGEVAPYVVALKPSSVHVEADAGNAPFPLLHGGPDLHPPLPGYTRPMVPVASDQRAAWTPGGAELERTLQVRLARPPLVVAGADEVGERVVEITVRLGLARGAEEGSVAGRVLSVSLPRAIAIGAEPAAACFHRVATATLDFITSTGGAAIPAIVTMNAGGAVHQQWVTAPCRVWTDDLAAAIAADPDSLDAAARLLAPSSYPQPSADGSLVSNDWEGVLADLSPDLAAIDALAADPARDVFVTAVPALRTLLATAEYDRWSASVRRSLRRLVWKAQLHCGSTLNEATVRRLAATAPGDLGAAIARLQECPASPPRAD